MLESRLRFEPTRDGSHTVYVDGVALHSRYEPTREAERLVGRQIGDAAPSLVVVVGPGLGHIVAAVRRRHRHARIVSVAFDAELARHAHQDLEVAGCRSWAPGHGELMSFLRHEINELDLNSIAVVDPPAAARIFPQAHTAAIAALRIVLAEQRGTLATTAAFGRRWIRNAIRNVLRLEQVTPLRSAGLPIVIAASGPSLELVIAELRAARRLCLLWALPSAVPALTAAELTPDVIVITDAGYYGASHLFHRQTVSQIAMPLSAAPVPNLDGVATPVTLFAEGHEFERPLFAALGVAPPPVPAAGTVAASALRLALQLQARSVFLVGLDLCYLDLQGHARPNVAASLLNAMSSRTSPYPALLYAHAQAAAPERQMHAGKLLRRSTALDTYASWFASLSVPAVAGPGLVAPPDLARVEPTPVATPALRSISRHLLKAELRAATRSNSPIVPVRPPWPGRDERLAVIVDLLSNWSSAIEAAAIEPPDRLAGSIARHLIHYSAPVELMRVVAAQRRGDPGWERQWQSLLQGCNAFVDNLAWRVRRAS